MYIYSAAGAEGTYARLVALLALSEPPRKRHWRAGRL